MEAKAIAKTVRIAPRKARLVIDLIRNKDVKEALDILENLNKEGARIIKKVLVSATANAENNLGLDKNKLYVKEAFVDEGATMKRARMGSRGHVDPIMKSGFDGIFIVISKKVCQ